MANSQTFLWSKETPGYICVGADYQVDLRIVDPDTCEEVRNVLQCSSTTLMTATEA
jgi:hypothetical protein